MTKQLLPPTTTMMTRQLSIIISLLCVFIISNSKTAFATKPDMRMRLSGKINAKITKKIEAEIEYEHRFDQYLTTFDKAFIEPAISYQATKTIQLGLQYRFVYDQNNKRKRSFKQRVAGYAKYKFKSGDFDIKIKTAIQYGVQDLTNSSNNKQKLISRNAIDIEYNWFGKKLKQFAGYEFFYHINNSKGAIINQWRLKFGTKYRLTKTSSLTAYYMFENEFNVVSPTDSHILGLSYCYSFL